MKIKFAEEDNHAPRSLWYASNSAGMLSVVHCSTPLYLLHLSLSYSLATHDFDELQLSIFFFQSSMFLACFKVYIWKWAEIVRYSQVIWLTRIDLKTDCILCVLASGKQGKKKKKQASVTPGHVTVTVPGHRGQWDKSSCCPQNRARASIRTGRRLCGNKQRSLWSAELFL